MMLLSESPHPWMVISLDNSEQLNEHTKSAVDHLMSLAAEMGVQLSCVAVSSIDANELHMGSSEPKEEVR